MSSSYPGRKHPRICKLQIHLVPANGRAAKILFAPGHTSPRKFLHLTESQTTIYDLADEVREKFVKLYPDHPVPEVIRIQDSHGCDLDPDYSVDQVFDDSKQVRVVISTFVPPPSTYNQHASQYSITPFNSTHTDLPDRQSSSLPLGDPSTLHRKRNYGEIDDSPRPNYHRRRGELRMDSINYESRNSELKSRAGQIIPYIPKTNTSASKSPEEEIIYRTVNENQASSVKKDVKSDSSMQANDLESRRHTAAKSRPFDLNGLGLQKAVGPVVLNGENDSEFSEEFSSSEGSSIENTIAESPAESKWHKSGRTEEAMLDQDDFAEDQHDTSDHSDILTDGTSSVVQKSDDSSLESEDDQPKLRDRAESIPASTASGESSLPSSSVSFEAPDPLAVIHPTPPLSPVVFQKEGPSNQSNISDSAHPTGTQEPVSLPPKPGLSTPVSGISNQRQKASPFRTLTELARNAAPDAHPSSTLKIPVPTQPGLRQNDEVNESSTSEEDSESSSSEEINSKFPPQRRAGRNKKHKNPNGMAALLRHCGDTNERN